VNVDRRRSHPGGGGGHLATRIRISQVGIPEHDVGTVYTSLPAPMPRPTRDYPLIFKNEIAKLDAKIAKLLDDRAKLIQPM
jgi:hypothetical protein